MKGKLLSGLSASTGTSTEVPETMIPREGPRDVGRIQGEWDRRARSLRAVKDRPR